MTVGARYLGDGKTEFVVWSPKCAQASIRLVEPTEEVVPMTRDEWGYWRATPSAVPGSRYFFRVDDLDRPDPASCSQPGGVHAPSEVIDHSAFQWMDGDWAGVPLERLIIYELHVGTFTPEGTFDAILPRLDELRRDGITALELMPVAQFPGNRNWGYDGVYPFAVHESYGGPVALKRLVDAAHRTGLAVVLDVVYNHLGPEGNYLADFAPYFTDKYRTPWGRAVNFDGAYSDDVRDFFIQNALYWFDYYHIDALRLDAIHAICDMSARPFLQELADAVDGFSCERGRRFYLIAESSLNDARVIRSREEGGLGLDAQWCDDFHHSLRTLLTGELQGYYAEFGNADCLAKAYTEGFVYSGQYSRFRKRRHGSSSKDRPGRQFVVSAQNHDQVGNRMLGERLSSLVPFDALKLAAGAVLVAPYIPLLFMGEEYGEPAPFLFFVSHGDAGLVEAVRRGRREEFREFNWDGEPPDPQDVATFQRSKLDWRLRNQGQHSQLLAFYRRLIELRASHPVLCSLDKEAIRAQVFEDGPVLVVHRWRGGKRVAALLNFSNQQSHFAVELDGPLERLLDAGAPEWGGRGSVSPVRLEPKALVTIGPFGFAIYDSEGVK